MQHDKAWGQTRAVPPGEWDGLGRSWVGWKDVRCRQHWIPGYGPQSSRVEPGMAWQRSGLIYQRWLRRLKGGVLGKAVRPHTEGHRGAKGSRPVDGSAGRLALLLRTASSHHPSSHPPDPGPAHSQDGDVPRGSPGLWVTAGPSSLTQPSSPEQGSPCPPQPPASCAPLLPEVGGLRPR